MAYIDSVHLLYYSVNGEGMIGNDMTLSSNLNAKDKRMVEPKPATLPLLNIKTCRMNHEFWNKMAQGITEHSEKYFKERLLEILPEERDVAYLNVSQFAFASGWNKCLQEIKKRAGL